MLVTNIESRISPEIIDFVIKAIIQETIDRRHILNFIKQCGSCIPGDAAEQSVDSKFYLTFTGSFQQKLVVCYDSEHASAESVRTQFESLYDEKFIAGDNSTRTLRISGLTCPNGRVTVSMFGIITDNIDDKMINV